jgi:glycosyltransferase involved in cell wall biosynthesis
MESADLHRAPVPPVPAGVARPLWSVMIPTYNCAALLRESLGSVLAQDPGPAVMQIEVVDDCSTQDDPEAVVAELGGGRVDFHRQPRNVGHSRNFSTCLQRTRGHLVHLLHGDDHVGDGFYAHMQQLFADHPAIGAGFCRHLVTNADGSPQRLSPLERADAGVLDGWLETVARELRVQPPAVVVRRAVYEQVGGFDDRMRSAGEDWEMWVRVAVRFPFGYVPETLAYYRDNTDSLTKRAVRSGQNIRDVRLATHIARAYLPPGAARAANRRAEVSWARWALSWAEMFVRRGEYRPALVQLREALLCSRAPEVVAAAARLAGEGALGVWAARRAAWRERRAGGAA